MWLLIMAITCFIWESVRIMFVPKLVRLCDRHASKLRCASHFRSLSSEETDFLSSYDMYQEGLLGIIQLRTAARKFFEFE